MIPVAAEIKSGEIERELFTKFRSYSLACLKVQTKDGKLVPFKFNVAQELLDQIVNETIAAGRPVRIVVLKARREGVSTYVGGRFYWKTSLRENRYASTVTHEPEATETLFGMTKRFHNHVPARFRPPEKYNRVNLLQFEGLDSAFRVGTAEKEHFGSGQGIHFLHLSEVSKWPVHTQANLLISALQAVPDGQDTEIYYESTAFGIGGAFHHRYLTARYRYIAYLKDGKPALKFEVNEDANPADVYTSVFFPWFIFPEYKMDPPSNFVRTKDEEELAQLHGLDSAQLYWRRYIIANKCSPTGENLGKTPMMIFWQEYPSCIAGSVLIGTDLGLIRLDEAENATRTGLGRILGFCKKGVRPVFQLTTALGYSVVGTEDHPVAMLSGGWRPIGELATNDQVVLSPPMFSMEYIRASWKEFPTVETSILIHEKWGRFLGYFMGDGSYHNCTLSFVCDVKDEDVAEDITVLVKELLGLSMQKRIVGAKKGGLEVRVGSTRLKYILDGLGLLRQNGSQQWKRNICIPNSIFESPKPVIREFLRGLFETDGFNGYGHPKVVLFSKYPEFLKNVQLLLLGFGITARFVAMKKKSGNDSEYLGYELCLRKLEALRFNDEIGFISARKKSRNFNRPQLKNKASHPLPLVMSDRVVSVNPAGEEDVYDITVEGAHSFSANGILVHNCPEEAFLATGRTIFDSIKVNELKKIAPKPIARYDCLLSNGQWIAKADGALRVWKEPMPGRQYVAAADVAEGLLHGDFDSADVIDRLTGEQVAHWHGKVDPDQWGQILYWLGMRYNTAWLAPERNNHGNTTVAALFRMQYPLLCVELIPEPPGKPRKRYGWLTTERTKHLCIDNLVSILRENSAGINCAETYTEMLTFVLKDNGKIEAQEGLNDDRVMSYAIAKYVSKTLPLPSMVQDPLKPGGVVRQVTIPPNPKGWT